MSYTTIATQFIERDYRVMRGLFESRLMTLHHIAGLYFGGSLDAARKRVWKLKNAGVVSERTRSRPYDPSILFLTRQGFEILTAQGRLIDYPSISWHTMQKRTNVSPLTLQHELDVMTAKTSMVAAVNDIETYKVAEFSTWPRLFAFESKLVSPRGYAKRTWIKADAFIRIREADTDGFDATEHLFYLELDRSTEAQSRLQAKAGAYADHYRSGGLARRFGAAANTYEQFPFRVLVVCRTEERRNNMAAAMLTRRPPILTMFWLTTFDELRREPLGPIWIRPIDYRNVTVGTAFDPYREPEGSGYKRRVHREEQVKTAICKHGLIISKQK